MQLNLPVVPITDLAFRDNDLVAATAGRAFWILDDLGVFQQYGTDRAFALLTPKPTYHYGGGGGLPGKSDAHTGTNAPEGVILNFYLPEAADTNLLKLEITNAAGKLLQAYSNKKITNIKNMRVDLLKQKHLPVKKE